MPPCALSARSRELNGSSTTANVPPGLVIRKPAAIRFGERDIEVLLRENTI
jgi:hypothetical protein